MLKEIADIGSLQFLSSCFLAYYGLPPRRLRVRWPAAAGRTRPQALIHHVFLGHDRRVYVEVASNTSHGSCSFLLGLPSNSYLAVHVACSGTLEATHGRPLGLNGGTLMGTIQMPRWSRFGCCRYFVGRGSPYFSTPGNWDMSKPVRFEGLWLKHRGRRAGRSPVVLAFNVVWSPVP